jgi:hypothetical protein
MVRSGCSGRSGFGRAPAEVIDAMKERGLRSS